MRTAVPTGATIPDERFHGTALSSALGGTRGRVAGRAGGKSKARLGSFGSARNPDRNPAEG